MLGTDCTVLLPLLSVGEEKPQQLDRAQVTLVDPRFCMEQAVAGWEYTWEYGEGSNAAECFPENPGG